MTEKTLKKEEQAKRFPMYPNLVAQKVVNGFTDEDMAEIIGVNRDTYRNKMKKGTFTAQECVTYCTKFKKTFEYLFESN